jgi:hypothetical protein
MVKIKNTSLMLLMYFYFLDFEVQQRYIQMEGVKGLMLSLEL